MGWIELSLLFLMRVMKKKTYDVVPAEERGRARLYQRDGAVSWLDFGGFQGLGSSAWFR